MPDQRSRLQRRLAHALDRVGDTAAGLGDGAGAPAAQASKQTMPPAAARRPVPSGRPWSIAAAMEPLAASPVARPVAAAAHPPALRRVRDRPDRRGRAAAVGVIALIAAAAAGVIAIHPHSPAAPGAAAPSPIAVTAVRTVDSAGGTGAPTPRAQPQYPAGTTTVYLDLHAPGPALNGPVEVTVRRAGGVPAVIHRRFVLGRGGDTVISLVAPAGRYAAGDYSVAVTSVGSRSGWTAFSIG